MKPRAREIVTFLILVFAFSSLPYFLMIYSGHIGAGNGLVVRLVMWCPTAAALVTCALFRIDLRTLAGVGDRCALNDWPTRSRCCSMQFRLCRRMGGRSRIVCAGGL